MTQIPNWLSEQLRCPQTGLPLTEEIRDGRPVLVAKPEGADELVYEIDSGVPILLPQRD